MNDSSPVLFEARPSLRRAYFYAAVYTAAIIAARSRIDPEFSGVFNGGLAVLIVLLILVDIRRRCTSYTVTAEYATSSAGILRRAINSVPVGRITNVSLRQSVGQRLLGLSDVFVDTAGGDRQEIAFRGITKTEGKKASEILRRLLSKPPMAAAAAGGM